MAGWENATKLVSRMFKCGYCRALVGSAEGYRCVWQGNLPRAYIYVCPNCSNPTFVAQDGSQFPAAPPGADVANLPSDVEALYREARLCVAFGAYTSAVLSCRKLLMHVAVAQQAPPGKSFIEYVEYLAQHGYVPPNGRAWVDEIRRRGNEANHEIRLMKKEDAEELISFAEMLLRFIYEFPARVRRDAPQNAV
jgi:hypothetical protein